MKIPSLFFLTSFTATTFVFGRPIVITPPKALSPGQTLVVESPSPTDKPPLLIWGEQKTTFYKSRQKRWRVLVRVPLEALPGMTTLHVQSQERTLKKNIRIPIKIEIRPSDFGFETIRFDEEKSKLLNDPSEDEESRLIRVYLSKGEDDQTQHWKGAFQYPVPGELLSSYGVTREKVGQNGVDFHRGIDLTGKLGDPIRAPNAAVVLMTKDFKFHGKTVLLNHGQGIGSIYIHMNSIDVREGEKVELGQTLGTVGSSGLATGPHLHWGIYVHGKAVDPIQWIETAF